MLEQANKWWKSTAKNIEDSIKGFVVHTIKTAPQRRKFWFFLGLLSMVWYQQILRLWPGMDGFSNFISLLVSLPGIIIAALALEWVFKDSRE